MKFLFLGTGAAGSKNRYEHEITGQTRRCASLLMDGRVLVDVAKQSFDYATKLGVDTSAVTDVFVSHMHRDHYNKEAFLGYANAVKGKINIWCSKVSVPSLGLSEEELEKVNVCPIEPMQEFDAAGMHVVALPGNHAGGKALHYIFEKDGKRVFYGLDGGWMNVSEWRYIFKNEIVFDAVILDSTFMSQDPVNYRGMGEHNNVLTLPILVDGFRQVGAATEETRIIADHIGGHMDNETVLSFLRGLGMIPAYDGFEIEI